MRKNLFVCGLGVTAFIILLVVSFCSAGESRHLFFIERSKNANIVYYDVNLDNSGTINPANPVSAYWILNAVDGKKKELGVFDKKAYGFQVKKDENSSNYTLHIIAFKKRAVKIIQKGKKITPVLDINNKPSMLVKIFIMSVEDHLFPKVRYIELYGKDLKSKKSNYEKIMP